jgi:hypothetical protein
MFVTSRVLYAQCVCKELSARAPNQSGCGPFKQHGRASVRPYFTLVSLCDESHL